jgi:ABC-type multidrug transport system ATPase subunit
MEPVVHLRSAVSVLGRFPALAGVDLDVAAGEIVHLQGPNGAGKTTLLRACAGLVPIVAGTVAHGVLMQTP